MAEFARFFVSGRSSMPASRAALVHRARHIDPVVLGRRIRSARAEVGLTQIDVVQRAFSPAYLSRIEAGHRRPTFAVLEHIAGAIDVSVESLLFNESERGDDHSELRLRLVQAEHRLNSLEPAQALELAEKVGNDADALRLVDVAERAQLVRAGALLQMGRHASAIPILESLVSSRRASATSVRARAALCRSYIETGRPHDAIAVAEEAQRLIADHDLCRLPEALDLSIEHASAYLRLSNPGRAVEIWLRARKNALFDGLEEVRAAYLAASERESDQGAYDQAWQHAERASALAELQAFQDKLNSWFPDSGAIELAAGCVVESREVDRRVVERPTRTRMT